MLSLSERQKLLLAAIINEFIDTAEAVGSIHLPMKYNLRVSPATVRNEMVDLVDMGLLAKEHASSGRIPTSLAFKYYIEEILNELDEMSTREEARMQEILHKNRFSADSLLFESVRALAKMTGNASVAVFFNKIYYAGVAEIVDLPEYQHPRSLKNLLAVLEDYDTLTTLFSNSDTKGKDSVKVLIGEEDTHIQGFEKTAIIFAKVNLRDGQDGYISVIGTNRMNYSQVIPAVRWMAENISRYA